MPNSSGRRWGLRDSLYACPARLCALETVDNERASGKRGDIGCTAAGKPPDTGIFASASARGENGRAFANAARARPPHRRRQKHRGNRAASRCEIRNRHPSSEEALRTARSIPQGGRTDGDVLTGFPHPRSVAGLRSAERVIGDKAKFRTAVSPEAAVYFLYGNRASQPFKYLRIWQRSQHGAGNRQF